jgi:hypothetical protein
METRWLTNFLAVGAVLLLVGCTQGLVPAAEPDGPAVSSRAAAWSSAPVHSVTGNGHVITGDGPIGQATWFWSFTAREYADGTYGGRVSLSDHSFEVKGHFPVVYLNVDDSDPTSKRALIVDYGEIPADWGGGFWYMAYVVTDNGEGRKDPSDVHTWGAMLADTPENSQYVAQLLAATPDGFFGLFGGSELGWTLTVDMGNIQVR